jgi:hypothetical protein
MKKLLLPMTLLMSCLFLLPALQVHAQDDPVLQAIYNDIHELYSKKAEQALKRDMNRFERMKTELEEVNKIKDNPGKKKGLDNYNKAHKEHYRKMLKDGGVNLQQVLSSLQQKYPAYNFSIVDDFSIMVRKKENMANASTASVIPEPQPNNLYYTQGVSGPNASNGGVYSTDDVLFQDLLFNQRKTVSCGLAAGGDVEFGPRMVKAWSTGVVAGKCVSRGDLENQTLIPVRGVRSATLTLNGTVECSGFALGIIGTSISYATTAIRAKIVETGIYFTNGILTLDKAAIAPALWYTSFSDLVNYNFTIDLTPWRGRTVGISAYSESISTSVLCCGTTSSAKATINTAFLNLVQ